MIGMWVHFSMSPVRVSGCQFYGGKQLQASVVTWIQGWLLLDPDCCVTPVTNNKLLQIWGFTEPFNQTKCTVFPCKILVQTWRLQQTDSIFSYCSMYLEQLRSLVLLRYSVVFIAVFFFLTKHFKCSCHRHQLPALASSPLFKSTTSHF